VEQHNDRLVEHHAAAHAILSDAGWDRVSARSYGSFWIVAGIDKYGRAHAGNTCEQEDTDDPCELARRLIEISEREQTSKHEHDIADASVKDADAEPPPPVAEGEEDGRQFFFQSDGPAEGAAASNAHPPEAAAPIDNEQDSVDDEQDSVDDEQDSVDHETASPLYGGTAFAQDEISALRADLSAAVDAFVESLIDTYAPNTDETRARESYLVNGLQVNALSHAEREELERFQRLGGWRLALMRHAVEMKMDILDADIDTLQVIDPYDGWPDPP